MPYSRLKISDFGGRLRFAMRSRGLTIRELAERIGLDTSNVEVWLYRGREPRLATMRRFADILDVPRYWLVTGDGPDPACPTCGARLLGEGS